MKIQFTAAAVACIAALTACSSPTTASNANFEKAINARLAERCYTLPMDSATFMGTLYGENWYPVSVELPGQGHDEVLLLSGLRDSLAKKKIATFDALERAGVLTSKPVTAKFRGSEETQGKEYALTDAGKTARVGAPKWTLCVGTPKVTEIVRYSKPSEAYGQTVSEVDFTYALANVPAWANDPKLKEALPGLEALLEPNQKGKASLVLMSDGWRDSRSTR